MKWEYIILDAEKHNFNALGQVGYELVAVDNGKAYFKRVVKDIIEFTPEDKNLDTPALEGYFGGKVG